MSPGGAKKRKQADRGTSTEASRPQPLSVVDLDQVSDVDLVRAQLRIGMVINCDDAQQVVETTPHRQCAVYVSMNNSLSECEEERQTSQHPFNHVPIRSEGIRREAASKMLAHFMHRRGRVMDGRFTPLGMEFDWSFPSHLIEAAGAPEPRCLNTQAFLIGSTVVEMTSYFRMASAVNQALQRLGPEHDVFLNEPAGTFERLLELSSRAPPERLAVAI